MPTPSARGYPLSRNPAQNPRKSTKSIQSQPELNQKSTKNQPKNNPRASQQYLFQSLILRIGRGSGGDWEEIGRRSGVGSGGDREWIGSGSGKDRAGIGRRSGEDRVGIGKRLNYHGSYQVGTCNVDKRKSKFGYNPVTGFLSHQSDKTKSSLCLLHNSHLFAPFQFSKSVYFFFGFFSKCYYNSECHEGLSRLFFKLRQFDFDSKFLNSG